MSLHHSLPTNVVWRENGGATLKTAAKEINKRLVAKLPKFGLRTHTVALDFGQWRSLPFCLPSLITSAIIITVPYFHNKRKTKYLFRRAIRLRPSCSCLRYNPVDEFLFCFVFSRSRVTLWTYLWRLHDQLYSLQTTRKVRTSGPLHSLFYIFQFVWRTRKSAAAE